MITTISQTNFHFPNQKSYYKGKVREVYTINDEYLVMIVSDRVSAFDVVLPRAIPFKGQVLNRIAEKALKAASDIVPNWIINVPHPNVTIGRKCEPFKVEMVIRGYLSGHAAREYKAGKRMLCGSPMPEGMIENDRFTKPIITPSTKADVGHDEDITREDIIGTGLVSEADYIQLENYTHALFQRGSEIANQHGLILVDTKYEFGKGADGKIYVIDEIHTPDSSRYFYLDGYEERQKKGESQKQLSKEFLREWLIANDFQGKEGQTVPTMTDEWVLQISDRYIELYEKLTGESFERKDDKDILNSIEKSVLNFLQAPNS
jgi:phosphoribosylaminoimidazole-succinocarboxamide synthase